MYINTIRDELNKAIDVLTNFVANDENLKKIQQAATLIADSFKQGGKVSDVSHISCVGNDYGFDAIFSRYVEGVGQKGDVLLGISTSGNSTNVIKAIEAAKQKGMKIITLTGKDGGKMNGLADVDIRVPHFGYADRVQEIHIKVIHILILLIEKEMA